MRQIAAFVALVAAATATSGQATTPRGSSGAYGVVMRGPVMPVCRADVPCDEPAAGVTLTFSRPGFRRSVLTTAAGSYRIRLAPGLYGVRTDQRPFGTIPKPSRVRILRARFARVDLRVDTGIR